MVLQVTSLPDNCNRGNGTGSEQTYTGSRQFQVPGLKTSGGLSTIRLVATNIYQEIPGQLASLCREDECPWLVGFSGGNWVARATRVRVWATRRHNTGTHDRNISHKRAQRSQRTRNAESFSLSALIPFSASDEETCAARGGAQGIRCNRSPFEGRVSGRERVNVAQSDEMSWGEDD